MQTSDTRAIAERYIRDIYSNLNDFDLSKLRNNLESYGIRNQSGNCSMRS